MGMPKSISIFNEIYLIDVDFESAERATVAYIAGDTAELGRIMTGVIERNLKRRDEEYSKRVRDMAAAAAGFSV